MSIAEPEPWALRISTAGGVGYLRPAPGTWASVAAALVAALLLVFVDLSTARWLLAGGVLTALLAGLWAIPFACRREGAVDPPSVVIDEVAGLWTALAVLPPAVLADPAVAIILCLLLFRMFDIAKPWPVGCSERLPGALGIMADDLAAGLLAGTIAAALLG